MTRYIIGSDEVGYGAWAGPLFVCAAAVPKDWKGPAGLTDSKELSPEERLSLYAAALQQLPMCVMATDNVTIDEIGVMKALIEAHTRAIQVMLLQFPDAEVIIDGVIRLPEIPQAQPIPKADAKYPVVSAASVIAKVNRDFVMKQLHTQYPHYGFDTGVGYGTKQHQRGLKEHGITPWHRKSYAPIKKLLEKK